MKFRSILLGCPRCYRNDLYRSRPKGFAEMHVLPLLLFRPLRCSHCMKRFYRPVFIPAKQRPEPLQQQRAAAA